ncbi:unnamed protein product [marine sediment metagenome]|uniref:Uncharacterized protein n=1 Tax=marine sediment metagenome TaxID=412755 RepID=X1GLA8_9ZZZZ
MEISLFLNNRYIKNAQVNPKTINPSWRVKLNRTKKSGEILIGLFFRLLISIIKKYTEINNRKENNEVSNPPTDQRATLGVNT